MDTAWASVRGVGARRHCFFACVCAYILFCNIIIFIYIYLYKPICACVGEFFVLIFENVCGVGGSATPGCPAERLENLEKYPHRRTLTASPAKTADKVAYNRHYVQQFRKIPIQDYSINFIYKKYRLQAWGRYANIVYLCL